VDLIGTLRATAASAGLTRLGVAAADPFPKVERAIRERAGAGFDGGLGFTYRHPERAADVRASFPWAQRLVVGGYAYLPTAGGPGSGRAGTGRVARFATRDHYLPLRRGLEALAGVLGAAGYRTAVICDDSRLVDRAAAVRAGVGWWGKNTMVLAPGWGPWLLLGSVVTDASLPVDTPMARDCGTCIACLPACPTGALVAPGVLDARRCLAALAQSPGPIPLPYRHLMADRLYGCDDCLEACPPGGRRLAGASHRREGRVDLVGVLAADDAALLRRFGHWYLPGRQVRYVRRNALVALGNSGGSRAVATAVGYLKHCDPLLRRHAAWALGALAGRDGGAALSAALADENDPEVAAEIHLALGERGGSRRGRGSVP
jgi:epoxyqueuosine reductase